MAFSVTELFLTGICLSVAYLFWKQRRPRNFPPGPMALPFIGNLHNLSLEPSKDFMKLGETYGDIFSIYFGPYPAIVLNSVSAIKEALAETAFSGRPKFEVLLQRTGGKPGGVIFLDGPDWVDQRRFILKNLRDFGFGKKSMEGLVQEEIKELIDTFKKSAHAGTPINTKNQFNAAVLNALWSIVSGERYSHSDPVLGLLIEELTSTISQSKILSLSLFFPFLRKILPDFLMGASISVKARRERHKRTEDFMKNAIIAHKDTFQENSPRDFIDMYIAEMARTKNSKSSFYKEDGDRNLLAVMNDLFTAGAETTSTTMTWEFLLMALHPEAQEKLFGEIKKVVGVSRLPSLSDKPLMPYTEAVIMEVMRFGAIIPTAVQHRVTEQVTFRGYTIPADTLVMPNLYGVMHDPKVWGDPEIFRPERFLSEDGSKVIRREELIPFSIGKRVCLGESLARDELFLFTTSLFQRFEVRPDPNSPPLKVEYYAAPVLIPKPHLLLLKDRLE